MARPGCLSLFLLQVLVSDFSGSSTVLQPNKKRLLFLQHTQCTYSYEVAVHTARGTKSTERDGFQVHALVDLTPVARDYGGNAPSHLIKLDIREPRLRRVRYGRVLSNHPVNEEFEEQLSKPFYFRQEEHGAVLDVLFSKADETPEVVAFKKGVAGAFQLSLGDVHKASTYHSHEQDDSGVYLTKYSVLFANDTHAHLHRTWTNYDYRRFADGTPVGGEHKLQSEHNSYVHVKDGRVHRVHRTTKAYFRPSKGHPRADNFKGFQEHDQDIEMSTSGYSKLTLRSCSDAKRRRSRRSVTDDDEHMKAAKSLTSDHLMFTDTEKIKWSEIGGEKKRKTRPFYDVLRCFTDKSKKEREIGDCSMEMHYMVGNDDDTFQKIIRLVQDRSHQNLTSWSVYIAALVGQGKLQAQNHLAQAVKADYPRPLTDKEFEALLVGIFYLPKGPIHSQLFDALFELTAKGHRGDEIGVTAMLVLAGLTDRAIKAGYNETIGNVVAKLIHNSYNNKSSLYHPDSQEHETYLRDHIWAFGNLGHQSGLPIILDHINHDNSGIRSAVISAMRKLPPEHTDHHLMNALYHDEHSDVKAAVVEVFIDRHQHLSDTVTRGLEHALWHAPESETLDSSIQELVENHGNHPKAVYLRTKRSSIHRSKRALFPFLRPREFALGPSKRWVKTFGGKWLGAESVIQFVNQVKLRIGIFGGSFEVNLDNFASIRAHILKFGFDVVRGKAAFKASASFKNDFPKDLIHSIADAGDDLIKQFDSITSVIAEQINKVKGKLAGYLPLYIDKFLNFVNKLVQFVQDLVQPLRPINIISKVIEFAKDVLRRVKDWKWLLGKIKKIQLTFSKLTIVDDIFREVIAALDKILDIVNSITRYLPHNLPGPFNIKKFIEFLRSVSVDLQMGRIEDYFRSLGFSVPSGFRLQLPFKFSLHFSFSLEKFQAVAIKLLRFANSFLDMSSLLAFLEGLRFPALRLPNLDLRFPPMQGGRFNFGLKFDWRVHLKFDVKLRSPDFLKFIKTLSILGDFFKQFRYPEFDLEHFFSEIMPGKTLDLTKVFSELFQGGHHVNFTSPAHVLQTLLENVINLLNSKFSNISAINDITDFFEELGPVMAQFLEKNGERICRIYKLALNSSQEFKAFGENVEKEGIRVLQSVDNATQNVLTELLNVTSLIDSLISEIEKNFTSAAKGFVSKSLQGLNEKLKDIQTLADDIIDFANGTASKVDGACTKAATFSATIIDTVQDNAREAITELTAFIGPLATKIKSFGADLKSAVTKVETWYEDNLAVRVGKFSRVAQVISDFLSILNTKKGFFKTVRDIASRVNNILKHLRNLPDYANRARKTADDVIGFADNAQNYKDRIQNLDIREKFGVDFDERLKNVCTEFRNITTDALNKAGSYDVVREVDLFFNEKADELISKGVSKFREIKEPIREIQEELSDIKSMARELMEVLINLRPFTKNFSPILSTAGKLPDCRQIKVIFTENTKPCVQKALVVGKYVLNQYKDFKKEIEVFHGMVPETWRTFKLQKCVKGGTCISKAFIDQAKVIKDKVDVLKDKFEEASGYSDMLQTCERGVDNITAVVDTLKLLIEQVKNFTLKDDVQKVQTVLRKITGRNIKEGGGSVIQKRSIKDVKERIERIVDYIQKAKDVQKKMEDLIENSFKAMRNVYDDAIVEHVQALEDVRAKIKRSYHLWQKTKDINSVLQGLETVTKSASDYADNLKGVTASFSNPIVNLLAETGDLSNFVEPYLNKYTKDITETATKVNGFLDKITDFLNAFQLRQKSLDPSAYKPWQEISYCSEEVCLRSLRRSSSLYLKTIFTWKFPHLDDLSSMDRSGGWLTPGLFDDYKVEGIAQLSKNEMLLGMHGVSSNKEKASLLVVTNFGNGVKKIIQLGSQGNPSLVKIGGVAIARDVIWISDKTSSKIHSIKKASVTGSFSSSKPSWVGISNTVSVEGAASSVSYDERSNVLWLTDGAAGKAYGYKLSATGDLDAAGLAPDRVIHIGQDSQGMTIVRQFNTEYVCVSKCAMIAGYQCKLEFHDVSGGDETGENTLVRVVRTPSGLESVNSVDSEVIALAFSSGTFADKDSIELIGGDFEDRYFRIRLPILKLTFGIHENCLFFRVVNNDILRPRRLFPFGDMICGTTRKRSVTQDLLESDIYSEQLEEVHRTNNRVRREASDLGSCLTLFRGNVIRGYQKFFPEYSQIIIVFGIPVRLFAGAGGFYSVDYQGQVCMKDKIFRLSLIPGAWVSVYAGAAVSLFIVEAGITIEAILLETYFVPELRIKIDKWPLQACIELKLQMTPLRIRVWLWYRFRLCIRIKCKLFGCSIKIRWCSRKTLAEWWWSARSIDRTLFTNCQAKVDRTPPIAGTCTARQAADKTYFVQWHGFREDTKINSYQVRIGSIPGSGDDYSSWVGTSLSLVVADLSIMHGRDVHFSVKATNDDRLDSPLAYCPKFQASRKGPQIRYVFDGVTEGQDVDYQSDDYALGMNFAFKSDVKNIVYIKWGISTSSNCTLDEAESNIVPMTQLGDSSSIQISGLDLDHGKTYFTRLHAMNSFGLKAVMCSDGILIDTTPPIPGNFQDGAGEGDAQFLPSIRRVRGKFDRFLDPESPIVKYEWKIVRNDSDIDVTSFVNIPLTQQTPLMDGLSLEAGSSYRLVLRGTNAAGLQKTVETNGFTPDPTPPDCEGKVIDVIDEDDTNDVDFVRELKSIQAKWSCMDPESSIQLQLVGVGTYPGGDDVRRFENLVFLPRSAKINRMTFVSFSEVEIRARERYHVTVKIINGAGLKKTITSDGILIDTTAPTVAAQYIKDGAEGNDRNFTSERFTYSAHWEQAFADAESGIAEYRVALGSSPGLTDVLGLRNVGSQTSVSLSGLVLRSGQRYFVTVVGCNGVGMCINASSNGAVVDFVPPHAGKVITGLDGPPLLYQWMTKAVWARWNWCLSDEKRVSGLFNHTQCSNDSFFDVHSGIATFGISVASLKTDNLLALPKTVGTVRHTGRSINLEDGVYSVMIEAKDRAGVAARGLSNTFIVDSTPPVVSYIQHGYLGETVEYTNTPLITFKAYFEIEDDLSKVTAYKIGVGSYSGADDVMTFHTTTITHPVSSLRTNWRSQNSIPIENNRRYFITVWAINSAGLFSIKSSPPLSSDFDPPNNGIIMDGWDLTDAQYQSYSAIYRAHWYGFTDFSGIDKVRLGLSSHQRSDHCDVRKEELVPNSANNHVLFGLNLTSGQKYFACVKLVDRAGNSARFHSNGFLVDTSPPLSGVVYDGRPGKDREVQVESSILRASWLNFTEKETQIVSYQLAFGSLPGAEDTQEFTNVGLVNTATSSRLKVSELTSGQRYYATVIAYNVLGMPSDQISSDGVMVDFTPPIFTRPVRDGVDPIHGLRFTADGFLSATWNCEDLETSLQSVEIGFGLQPGQSGVVNFTDVPIQQTSFITDRTLQLGYRYFATVRCVNKVGLQATSFSNGVVYDDSPPRPLYVRDGDYQGPNTNVTVAFKFVDAESGISKFQVKVWGTDNTGNVMDIHGPFVFDRNVGVISIQTRKELVSGRKYVVNVTAINGAGLNATVESDGFVIDSTPPICSFVWDGKEGYENDVEYVPSQSKRIISWICYDKESPIVRYRFAVSNLGTGDLVIPFYALKSAVNSSGFAIITGGGRLTPKYEDGHRYAVGIEITNAAGRKTVNWTNGVLVDSTPPVFTNLKLRFAPKNHSLAAEWTVKDDESGIKSLAWGIGTSPELDDIKKFTNLSLSTTSLSIANVPLELGRTYFLSLFTVNKAGLSSRTASNGVVIDRTPPNHGTVLAQYVFPKNYDRNRNDVPGSSFVVTWTDFTDPESGIKTMSWAVGADEEAVKNLPGDSFSEVITDDSVGGVVIENQTLVGNETYFACIRARNGAGLDTTDCSLGMFIVLGKFSPGVVNDGPVTSASDVDFQLDDRTIWVHWDGFKDPVFGISRYDWCIRDQPPDPSGSSVCKWPFTEVLYLKTSAHRFYNLTLLHGKKYYVTVKAENSRGETVSSSSDGVVVDRTPPIGKAVQVFPASGKQTLYVTSPSPPVVTWSMEDPESGMSHFLVGVGSFPFQDDLLTFHRVDSLSRSLDLDLINFTLYEGLIFYVTVTGVNMLGLETSITSQQVVVDWTPPEPGEVVDGNLTSPISQRFVDVDYQSDQGTLSAHWQGFQDAESDVMEYSWCIGTAQGFCDVQIMTSADLHTSAHHQIDLEEGQRYFFTVEATNAAGLKESAFSDGVTIDTSPPVIKNVLFDIETEGITDQDDQSGLSIVSSELCSGSGNEPCDLTQKDARLLSFSWEMPHDVESGISSVVWCAGAKVDLCDIIPWTHVDPEDTVVRYDFSSPLASGTVVVVKVKAVNGAGMASTAVSKALLIDSTPPSVGIVIVGNDPEIKYFKKDEPLIADWSGFDDRESSISHYMWAVCHVFSKDDCVTPYVNVGLQTTVQNTVLDINPGASHILVVRAYNKVGLFTDAVSNQFILDASIPSAGTVYDGVNELKDVEFQSSTSEISANWSPFTDTNGRIANYEMCVGTELESCDISDFISLGVVLKGSISGLNLTHNRRYFATVRATNNAGYTALATSNGVLVDSTTPLGGEVRDGQTLLDLNYQSDSKFIYANWDEFQDSESDVIKYSWCAGTGKGICDIIVETDVGDRTSVSQQIYPALARGMTAYVTVRAYNGAGAFTRKSSDGIKVDNTAPVISKVLDLQLGLSVGDRDFLTAKDAYCTSWDVEDSESGVAKNTVSVCSAININDCLVRNQDAENRTIVCIANVEFVEGVKYVTKIRSQNKVGLTSELISDGFVFDSTPPVIGEITHVENTNLSLDDTVQKATHSQISVQWDGFWDKESSVRKYHICVGTQPGQCDVMNFTDIGSSRTYTSQNLPLVQDEMYFMSLKAENEAGLISEVKASDGVFVDKTGPINDGQIFDGNKEGVDIDIQRSRTDIAAHWSGFIDVESDVIQLVWCAGSFPGSCDLVPETKISPMTTSVHRVLNAPIRNGDRYYVTIKATNGAGVVTSLTSDGVTVDDTRPSPGAVINGDGFDVDYLNGEDDISAHWSGFEDEESGIEYYEVALCDVRNASSCPQPFARVGQATNITITGLDLESGAQYSVTVRAVNFAGLKVDASSRGFTVDFSPPTATKARVGAGEHPVKYQTNLTQVVVSWPPFTDSESGITKYEVCVTTAPEYCTVSNFINVGLSTDYTVSGLHLSHGETYYAIVRGTNGIGMFAETSTDGVLIDITPPILKDLDESINTTESSLMTYAPTTGLSANNSMPQNNEQLSINGIQSSPHVRFSCSEELLTANWDEFEDIESDLLRYEWCVGTSKSHCDVLALRLVGVKARGAAIINRLPSGTVLFATVYAVNGANLKTRVVSEHCKVISVAPKLVEVIDIPGLNATNVTDIDWKAMVQSLSLRWEIIGMYLKDISRMRIQVSITHASSNLSLPRIVTDQSWNSEPFAQEFVDVPSKQRNVTLRSGKLQPWQRYRGVIRVHNEGDIYMEASSDGIRIEPSPPPERSLSIRDKAAEQEHLRWLPNLHLPPINQSVLDPEIKYVSSPKDLELIVQSGSNETGNVTSFILDHDLFSPTKHFMVVVKRVTSDTNDTNTTESSRTMKVIPGFSNPEGPCCTQTPLDPPSVFSDLHLKATLPAQQFGASLAVLRNDFLAVGSVEKAYVFSLKNTTANHFTVPNTHLGSGARPINIASHQNRTAFLLNSEEVLVYDSTVDDFGNLGLHNLVVIRKCKNLLNVGCSANDTWADSISHVIALHEHVIAITGSISVTNASVVGVFRNQLGVWTFQGTLGHANNDPYFGHSLSFNQHSLAIAGVEGRNPCIYIYGVDPLGLLMKFCFAEDKNLTAPLSIHLTENDTLVVVSKRSRSLIVFQLNTSTMSYIELCRYSMAMDEDLSGSLDVTGRDEGFVVALGMQTLHGQDGVQLIGFYGLYTKNPSRHRVGECINLGRVVARESGLRVDDGTPRAIVSLTGNTVLFGTPSVLTWPGNGERSGTGRIYMATHCPVDHVRIRTSQVNKFNSVSCAPCEMGRKSFGGFVEMCSVCEGRVCSPPKSDDPFSFKSSICNNMSCRSFSSINNLTNGIDVHLMNGSFFIPGPENVYTVELAETTRADLSTRSLSESFLIDPTAPEPGVVYDGLGSDQNTNCSENSTFSEDSQCSTRSFTDTDIDYTNNTREIHARWIDFLDSESDIVEYFWCVGSQPMRDDILSCESTGMRPNGSHYDLNLKQSESYYVTVIACNGARRCSAAYSDGVTIDTTPPVMNYVRDGIMGPDMDFQVFVDIIFAYFAARDDESGVTSYEVAWGTAPGLTDMKEFEEVTNTTIWLAKFKDNALEKGKKYYATVRATNAAGLLSDRMSSNGIVVGKSEYIFDNSSSASFFFDTVNVNENGSRKDGGVGKTYGTLTVPEGAVEGQMKLRSFSLDDKALSENKTEEGPVSDPKITKPKQFMLGNYSFMIKALDPVNNSIQEGYQFAKPITLSMFYDVDNLVKANKKHVNNEVTEEDIDPVLYLWHTENKTWFDASLTCPEPWSYVNHTIKLLMVQVCHLTQFAFFWSFHAQNGLILLDKNNTMYNSNGVIKVSLKKQVTKLDIPVRRSKGSQGNITVQWSLYENGSTDTNNLLWPASGEISMTDSQWNDSFVINLANNNEETTERIIWVQLDKTTGGAVLASHDQITAKILIASNQKSFSHHPDWLIIGVCMGVLLVFIVVVLLVWRKCRQKHQCRNVKGRKLTVEVPHLSRMPVETPQSMKSDAFQMETLSSVPSTPEVYGSRRGSIDLLVDETSDPTVAPDKEMKPKLSQRHSRGQLRKVTTDSSHHHSPTAAENVIDLSKEEVETTFSNPIYGFSNDGLGWHNVAAEIEHSGIDGPAEEKVGESH